MGIETTSAVQVAFLVTFILTLFVLYRVLVKQKDATIEVLKERNAHLKEQLANARESTPDVLARSLSERVNVLKEELSRLREDKATSGAIIEEKERDLSAAQQELGDLKRQLEQAQKIAEEYFCPTCRAPMAIREYHSETVEIGGRDGDIEHEYVAFECGLTFSDGSETAPCQGQEANKGSSSGTS